jgi:hypothetical protein
MCAVCFTSAQLVPVAGVLARAAYVARRGRVVVDTPPVEQPELVEEPA